MSNNSDEAIRKAYELGRQARANLEPITACPYKHSEYGLGFDWDNGWRAQDLALQERLYKIAHYVCPKCSQEHNSPWLAIQCCIAPSNHINQ